MRFFLLPALLLAAEACTENGHVSAPGLQPWEVALLKDCPVSALGDVRPDPASPNPSSRSDGGESDCGGAAGETAARRRLDRAPARA